MVALDQWLEKVRKPNTIVETCACMAVTTFGADCICDLSLASEGTHVRCSDYVSVSLPKPNYAYSPHINHTRV
eukprot:scaffold1819_cov160-Amphora_coffeaeformis.AAC.12